MAMKWKPAPPEAVAAFGAATKDVAGLDHRKMFGYDAVFTNDRMVGGLHEVGMVLRLSDADRERFAEQYQAKPFVVMGRTMREYVVVPAALYDDPKELTKWVERGRDYASSMPAKEKARPPRKASKPPVKRPASKSKAQPKSKAEATSRRSKSSRSKK
jgi:TfoX/Sxy family transcriptional regulator of competence genes